MLEEKIAALTVAVEALTSALSRTHVITDISPGIGKGAAAAIFEEAIKPSKARKAKVEEAPAPAVKVELEEVRVVGEERAKVLEKLPPISETPAKKVTLQDIREVAQQCLDHDKLSGVIGINKKYGLRKIGEATEDKFADLHADLTALLNAPIDRLVVQNG